MNKPLSNLKSQHESKNHSAGSGSMNLVYFIYLSYYLIYLSENKFGNTVGFWQLFLLLLDDQALPIGFCSLRAVRPRKKAKQPSSQQKPTKSKSKKPSSSGSHGCRSRNGPSNPADIDELVENCLWISTLTI